MPTPSFYDVQKSIWNQVLAQVNTYGSTPANLKLLAEAAQAVQGFQPWSTETQEETIHTVQEVHI